MRLPIIAGNWKMNKTVSEGLKLVTELKGVEENTDVEVVVCPPFLHLNEVKKALENTNIKIGAQNMHWEESGAYTGEISPEMLSEMNIDYVILGHSERREYFNETDETVNKKIKSAIKYGIKPIVCVGETLEEREANKANEKVERQILKGFEDIKSEDMKKVVIAYEPIWAIGTGKTASSKEANEMISNIRNIVKEKYGLDVSEEVRIQYGGSVKPKNVSEIMNETDIDGALVGGASLKSKDFKEIINF